MIACECVRSECDYNMSVREVVSRAILRPASSFFLHPREYSKIIRGGGVRLPRSAIKRELHLEILRRHDEIKAARPWLKTHEIAMHIEQQPAPRFYISEKRAADLYYALSRSTPK